MSLFAHVQQFSVQKVHSGGVHLPYLFIVQPERAVYVPVSTLRHKVIHMAINSKEYVARPFDLSMQMSL